MSNAYLKSLGLYDGHPFYSAWMRLRQRCDNPKSTQYKWYGGRGITYDPRWQSFFAFYNDMFCTWREGLTLDRIDNDGNYCQENCRWATKQEQGDNKGTYRKSVTNTSGLTNVYFNTVKQRWYAQAFENKKRIHLYSGISKDEAIQARLNWEAQSGKAFH